MRKHILKRLTSLLLVFTALSAICLLCCSCSGSDAKANSTTTTDDASATLEAEGTENPSEESDSEKKFKLESLLSVEITGSKDGNEPYNGLGVAHIEINEFFVNLLGNTEGVADELNEFIDSLSFPKVVRNVTNGVPFTIDIEYDEVLALQFDFLELQDTFTYTPEGMKELDKELEPIDIWDGITVEYSGIAPFGKATVKCDYALGDIRGQLLGDVSFELDRKEGLDNGDEIVVTAEYDVEALAEEGYMSLEPSKSFFVDGLSQYIISESAFNDKAIDFYTNLANNGEKGITEGSFTGQNEEGDFAIVELKKLSESELQHKSFHYWEEPPAPYSTRETHSVIVYAYEATVEAREAYTGKPAENRTMIISLWVKNPQISPDGSYGYDEFYVDYFFNAQQFRDKLSSWLEEGKETIYF